MSAFLAALFGAYNKRLIHRTDALSATALEMVSGGLLVLGLTALLGFWPEQTGDGAFLPATQDRFAMPGGDDLLYVGLLAVACTLLPFTLSLWALRHLSAFASALAVNLEPLYAIVLAMLFLGEQRELGAGFYAGASLLVGVVLLYPLMFRARPPKAIL